MKEKIKRYIEITTPENITIQLPLASPTDRWGAFLSDVVVLILVTVGLFLGVIFLLPDASKNAQFIGMTFLVLARFFLWNGYFIYYELKRGTTPGKKRLHFKVISQDGSFLPASAIYVRNLMREVEVWMPLKLIIIIYASGTSAFSSSAVYPLLWIIGFIVYPFLDPYKRRLGDVLAGTVVIEAEQAELAHDLTTSKQEKDTEFSFTDKMLDIYGKEELQVLEDILRTSPEMSHSEELELFAKLALKITRKIGWQEPLSRRDYRPFLTEFYEAQRAYLEKKLLHGKSLERRSKRRRFRRKK